MKFPVLVLAASLAAVGASCSKNGQPGDSSSPAGLQGAATSSSGAGRMEIPADAQWTIYCAAFSGPRGADQARDMKQRLSRNGRMRDWYVVQSDQESTLYYGFYATENDARARRDRAAIAQLVAANGERLFAQPCLMPLESADPAAPAEWNLANTAKEYTLQIAVYQDDPRRKEFAVQAVREARAAGIQAYYFHGRTSSLVCIGAWPAEAVEEPTEVRAQNPNELVVVATDNARMPENLDQLGRPVRIVQPQCVFKDPTILDAIKRYPLLSINGASASRRITDPITRQVTVIPVQSAIIHIPRSESVRILPPAGMGGPANPAGPSAAPQAPAEPGQAKPAPRPKAPAGGKLRSLDD